MLNMPKHKIESNDAQFLKLLEDFHYKNKEIKLILKIPNLKKFNVYAIIQNHHNKLIDFGLTHADIANLLTILTNAKEPELIVEWLVTTTYPHQEPGYKRFRVHISKEQLVYLCRSTHVSKALLGFLCNNYDTLRPLYKNSQELIEDAKSLGWKKMNKKLNKAVTLKNRSVKKVQTILNKISSSDCSQAIVPPSALNTNQQVSSTILITSTLIENKRKQESDVEDSEELPPKKMIKTETDETIVTDDFLNWNEFEKLQDDLMCEKDQFSQSINSSKSFK